MLHTTGPLCQNVPGLNATGAGVHAERSGLIKQLPGLRKMFLRAFPDCQQGELCEMVASLRQVDQKIYDAINSGKPLRTCPSGLVAVGSLLPYWINWPLVQAPDVIVSEELLSTDV